MLSLCLASLCNLQAYQRPILILQRLVWMNCVINLDSSFPEEKAFNIFIDIHSKNGGGYARNMFHEMFERDVSSISIV